MFLYPNCFAEAKARGRVPEHVLETQVDPAVFEMSGHIVLKRKVDYDDITQDFAWQLLELASPAVEDFDSIVKTALGE